MPDGSQLILGRQENTSSSETRITRSGAADVPAFGVLDGSGTAIAGSADRQPGVWGGSRDHNGIVGTSVLANGVWGRSSVPGAAGVFGENVSGYGMVATTRGFGVGLYARGLDRAGYFDGRVEVQGDLQVSGAKSAAVAHPDGSHRLLYALESPQSWFEDFGRSRISQGRARVVLDSDLAALVQTTDYHVFLTPEGDSNGLYVRGRNADSFEVCEQQGGKSDLAFTYRVVAKRKDIEAERLRRVEASPPPEPVQPPLPEGLALPPHG